MITSPLENNTELFPPQLSAFTQIMNELTENEYAYRDFASSISRVQDINAATIFNAQLYSMADRIAKPDNKLVAQGFPYLKDFTGMRAPKATDYISFSYGSNGHYVRIIEDITAYNNAPVSNGFIIWMFQNGLDNAVNRKPLYKIGCTAFPGMVSVSYNYLGEIIETQEDFNLSARFLTDFRLAFK